MTVAVADVEIHFVPSKHWPVGHSHVFTEWLFNGEHPHAPIRQLFGKSPLLKQHRLEPIVPPLSVQLFAMLEGVNVFVIYRYAVPAKAIVINNINIVAITALIPFITNC